MNTWTRLALMLPLLLAVPTSAPAQEDPGTGSGSENESTGRRGFAVGQEPEEPEIVVWSPAYGDVDELSNAVGQLFGSGGYSMDPHSWQVRTAVVGNTVIVSGPSRFIAGAVELLDRLDQAAKPTDETNSSTLIVREYSVRNITMGDARDALKPLSKLIVLWHSGGVQDTSNNISYIDARGTIIVHDTPDRVEQILALLERVDVPRPQVLMRAYLVRGTDGEHDARVPQEVAEGLRELVPYASYELVSFSMLRTDTTAKIAMSDAAGAAEYRMVLDPEAYDAELRRLTFASCEFDIMRIEGGRSMSRKFTTSASVTAGEYTVLGGVGADADFLVLHMSLVDGN